MGMTDVCPFCGSILCEKRRQWWGVVYVCTWCGAMITVSVKVTAGQGYNDPLSIQAAIMNVVECIAPEGKVELCRV